MLIRKQIAIGGTLMLVLLVALASMNVVMYRQVVKTRHIRDQVRKYRAELREYDSWKTEHKNLVVDMISSGHAIAPREEVFSSTDANKAEREALLSHFNELISLVTTKEKAVQETADQYERIRKDIVDIYRELDKKIATILALIQLDQVVGEKVSESSTLPPFILKSLNQLALIALNTLITRDFPITDKRIVERNRGFLASQLKFIDKDGSIRALFDRLLDHIDRIETLIPERKSVVQNLDERIARQKALFDQVFLASNQSRLIQETEDRVQRADAALEKTSRQTLIVSFVFLCVIPALAMCIGLLTLRRLVVIPLGDLMKTMRRFEQGDMEATASVVRKNEIGVLAETFNHMAAQIRTKVNDLNNLNQALRENEGRLKTILESSTNAFVVYGSDDKIQYLNPAFLEVFGWTLEELRNDESAFIPAEEAAQTFAQLGAMKEKCIPVKYLGQRQTKDGKRLDVIIGAAQIKGAEGEYGGMVVNLTDISEQRKLQTQLIQAQKMESIGRLAGGVAHDFNNMLGGVMGAAELLEDLVGDNPESKLYVSMIMDAAEQAATLASQLLAFGRKQHVSSTVISLHKVVHETMTILCNTLDKRISMHAELDAERDTVVGDPTQLQSVLLNLGINASHAMPEGGELRFRSRVVDIDEAYQTKSEFHPAPGAYIDVSVHDTGCGISPENLPRIFEPFFTTKEEGKGTGLGLAAAYGTIQQHKGAISVYSELGHGTVFHVLLPLTHENAESKRQAKSVQEGHGTILFIDDESVMRATGAAILENCGYVVLLASNGEEGVQQYRENRNRIDMVLCDMVMPKMNGRDCFFKIRELNPDIPFVISSGFSQSVDMNDLKKHGLSGFIQKPFRSAELSQVIANALAKKTA